jgi:Mrp family chromosome partitioning ATPase
LIHDAHDRVGPHLQRGDAQGRSPFNAAIVAKQAPSAAPVAPPEPVVWAWPAICDRLLSSTAGPGIRGLASLLCEMLSERRKRSLAFTGPGRGAGRTALLLTIARLLAEDRQLRVLMIDLDFGNPQLTQLLGIFTEQDLWQAACRNVATAVPLVTLVPDRLSLAPLRDRVSMTEITADRTAALRGLMQRWRNEFDLVLVDGGPWELFGSLVVRETATVEACVCVSHADRSTSGATDGERYRQAGMDFLGFIETFAPPDSQLEPPHTR